MKDDEEECLKRSSVERAVNSAGRILTTCVFTLLGFFVGVLARLFSYPTTIDSVSSLLWQYLPWGFVGAIVLGFLSYRYYRFAAFLVCFIPGCEIST